MTQRDRSLVRFAITDFADPDIHHHWPNVLQVLVATTANAHTASTISEALESDNFCPVCLDEPAAPRLTKCGMYPLTVAYCHGLTASLNPHRPHLLLSLPAPPLRTL